jgi:hypothetical protein
LVSFYQMTRAPNYAMHEADAASRLRYVSDVRRRTRLAATAVPRWMLPVLGALLIARGLLLRFDHHLKLSSLGVSSVALLAALLVLRVVAWRYLSHRRQLRDGVVQSARHRHAPAVAAVLVALLVPTGDAYVLALAAALALSAWIVGPSPIAAATLLLGIATGAMLVQGAPTWTVLIVFGAGLIGLAAARILTPGGDR